jgi:hypothetical protein
MSNIKKKTYINAHLYQVFLRKKGVPCFYITFPTKRQAQDWVYEHEYRYLQNPEPYLMERKELNLQTKLRKPNLKRKKLPSGKRL